MPTVYKDLFYVDLAGQPQKWKRYSLDEIPDVISELGDNHLGLFTSIQTYESASQVDSEPYDCDFVVDFDGADSLDHCRRLINHLLSLDITPLVYFSGNKGFHVITSRQSWGALTSPELNKQWKSLAWKLKKDFNLDTLDLSIYSTRRQLRVENSKHKSGLYKIPLNIDELSMPLEKIKELAKQPKRSESYLNRTMVIKAKQLFDLALSFMEDKEPEYHEGKDIKFDTAPPCIEAILRDGVFELHTINAVMFRLVAYFKSQEINSFDCLKLVTEWLHNIKPAYCMDLTPDGQVDIKSLAGQVASVIRSVYNSTIYGFSCGGIKSVIGERFCTEKCKTIIEERLEVNLFAASKAEYLGKRIYTKAEAIGRQDEPYGIPEEIELRCNPTGNEKCTVCPLLGNLNGIKVYINARTSNVLDFIEYGTRQLESKILVAVPGLPSHQTCKYWSYHIKTNQNVEAIYVAPIVSNEFSDEDRYVREKAYYFGHGLIPNTSYEFSGFSHIAKDNIIKLCFDHAEPLSDTLSNFEQSPEMVKEINETFHNNTQSLSAKHSEIVNSISYNHIHVWGREMLLKAVDLVYHSVRKFYFQRDLVNGWLDILIIGDTGQAKSMVIKKFMQHYGLGIRAIGESGGRTGLLYTIPLNEKESRYIIWGLIPRHTGRLVVIDEARNLLEGEEIGSFTDARDGQLNVTKSAWGVAKTETRLIWMTNTMDKKTMRSYGYPILAVSDLIGATQNIRRFTFAIGVSSNQVDDAVINQDIEKITPIADMYTNELCQNHLLWVWNLKPEDVIIDKKIERRILALSLHMCREYVATIQLVEPGDFRLKLARVACAISARMSCREGDKLVVTAEAVDYAYDFINSLYKDESLKYYQYSVAHAEYALTEAEIEQLIKEFKNQWMYWEALGKRLMISPYIKSRELSSIIGIPEPELKTVLVWMSGRSLLESGRNYFYKTPIGIRFLEALVPESKIPLLKTASQVLADTDLGGDDF